MNGGAAAGRPDYGFDLNQFSATDFRAAKLRITGIMHSLGR
jgi:hypothetical protein